MPRYRFQCSVCENIQTVFIGMSEVLENCTECGSDNCMEKLFDNFYSNKKKPMKEKVGNITRKHIEDNKKILEEQKKEARSTDYEPSWNNIISIANIIIFD